MPAPLLPVKEIFEEYSIDTDPRDPDRIIYTKPFDTITHRKKGFSVPVIAYTKSGEPHIHRMYH
jgi:hypothetical protein